MLTISTSTASLGSYNIVLTATGDDPSVNNATLYANVLYNINVPKNQSNQTNASTTANASPNSSQANATAYTQTYYPTPPPTTSTYAPPANSTVLTSILFIIIILIATAYSLFKWKSTIPRLAIAGTALILLGTVAWLYGDYNGGLTAYIWGGVALIIIGAVVWLYSDAEHGAFQTKKTKR